MDLIKLITDNFQPWWMQIIAVSCLVAAVVTVVVYLWLAFWDWRDKKISILFENGFARAVKAILELRETAVPLTRDQNGKFLPRKPKS